MPVKLTQNSEGFVTEIIIQHSHLKMCACVHFKITLQFEPISGISVEISSGACEMFTSFGVLVIGYQRGSYVCKVQSHVPIIGNFLSMKYLAGKMTSGNQSFSHGTGSSYTLRYKEKTL
jgi:hypothetical protein